MKKQIKVIRSAKQTVVIYRDAAQEKAAARPMKQKPVPVYRDGILSYYIMPSGRCFPVRRGFLWRVVKLFTPRAQFVAV